MATEILANLELRGKTIDKVVGRGEGMGGNFVPNPALMTCSGGF